MAFNGFMECIVVGMRESLKLGLDAQPRRALHPTEKGSLKRDYMGPDTRPSYKQLKDFAYHRSAFCWDDTMDCVFPGGFNDIL